MINLRKLYHNGKRSQAFILNDFKGFKRAVIVPFHL